MNGINQMQCSFCCCSRLTWREEHEPTCSGGEEHEGGARDGATADPHRRVKLGRPPCLLISIANFPLFLYIKFCVCVK